MEQRFGAAFQFCADRPMPGDNCDAAAGSGQEFRCARRFPMAVVVYQQDTS